jgi:hypothetical protein
MAANPGSERQSIHHEFSGPPIALQTFRAR